jgi:hypothetical protein
MAGIALFFSWMASIVILGLSLTDTGERGFGHGAIDAVYWLYVIWTMIAVAV